MHAVVIIGSGFGGLSAAINLLKEGINDFIMLERRSFAGGTWLQNRYPGAAVDVHSPLYSLSGHPFAWSHMFAKQNELAQYTQHIIEQYQLSAKIRLNTPVLNANWDKDHWKIVAGNAQIFEAKILINATGPLSTPLIPAFEGLATFKGQKFHSNDWPSQLDLTNKTVAIIGSGASSVQIAPAIIDKVKHLHVVQRTPHWILPRPDFSIPKCLRKPLAFRPIYALIRWFIYWMLELRVLAFKYSKTLLKLVAQRPAENFLQKQVKDEQLRAKLRPDFIIGCKRILISNTYYPTLQKDNCTLHDKSDAFMGFTENGLAFENSGECPVDVVIFATGFNAVDSMVSYNVVGRNGHQLKQQWQDYPRAYLGTSLPNFPNLFLVTGPNTGIGHTSAIFVIESQMKYIMQCVRKLTYNGITSIEPTEYAEHTYTKMVHREMDKTVWAYGGCTSWYQNEQGKVVAMFPGFSFTFRRLCKKFTPEHHYIV